MTKLEADARRENTYEFENGEHPSLYYLKTIQVEDEDVSSYTTQRQALEKAQEKMQEAAREFFMGQAKTVFERHPKLQGIRVTAYTPYFNDGESCEYSVNDPYLKYEGLVDEDEKDGEGGNGYQYISDYYKDKYPAGTLEAYKEAQALISSITEDDFESLFGNHVQVTITREGVETDEYEHD